MAENSELKGGPQDGGIVRKSGDSYRLPDVVYVGPRPMGDGFAAWSDGPCKMFPAEYVREQSGEGTISSHRYAGSFRVVPASEQPAHD